MRPLVVVTMVVAILSAAGAVQAEEEGLKPMPFSDLHLPENRLIGGTHIDILGRVKLLPKFLPVNNIEKLTTRFSIYSRQGYIGNIEFDPTRVGACDDVWSSSCEGYLDYSPYDLHRVYSGIFNVKHKTIIMIGGYLTKDNVVWVNEARKKWLELEDVNIIHVTWSDSNKWIYSSAVSHTPLVARQIVIMLYYLALKNGVWFRDKSFLANIHFVGHSLGAHIGGFVGKDLGGEMGRITGLDPAGPAFDELDAEYRLNKGDAIFVDTIHTNSGRMTKLYALGAATITGLDMLINKLPLMDHMTDAIKKEYSGEGDTAWFGIDQNLGHVDYYANNGKTQPGCCGLLHVCDHGRAHDILIDILRHELSLKNLVITPEQRKANRLLAFPADSYESFLSGSSLRNYCPSLISIDHHLSREVTETINKCSLPLDLLTSGEELLEEMKTKYFIDRLRFAMPAPRLRHYYFKTLSPDQGMLVGDHYLLKLYLTDEPIWNSERCSLNVEIQLNERLTVDLSLQDIGRNLDSSLPTTLAMPFVQPFGQETRAIIDSLAVGLNETKSAKISPEMWQDLKHVFLPNRLTINIGDVKSKGVFETIKNKLKKLISTEQRDCSLRIGMVEIHPVNAHNQKFAGIYGFEGIGSDEELNKVHIYSVDQQVKVPWLDEEISTIGSDYSELHSTTRKLVGLVVN